MKKLLILVFLVAPVLASAATVAPETKDIEVTKGQTVTIEYMLEPVSGEKAYTVKLLGDFPANLLELTSFTFGGTWIALPQPGYDEINSTKGTFIKTAGYPRGTASATPYGTAMFTAKAAGTAHISVGSGTVIYDAKNKNIFRSSPLLPAQLFDIRLLLDRGSVARILDLVARVTFESFGRVPTPVEMTFSIIQADGQELWKSVDTTTVQTSAVFVKRFFEAGELAPGTYTLRLRTLYNTDVEDTFEAQFTISPEAGKSYWVFWFIGILLLIILLLFFLWRRRRKDEEENERRGLFTPMS